MSGNIPSGRNGHSFEILKGSLLLFGGIIEVTKESAEVFKLNPSTGEWELLDSGETEEIKRAETLKAGP